MNINAEIQIQSMDYETTIQNLFPYLMEHEKENEKMELLFRLLDKLGEDTFTLIRGFTKRFSAAEKNRLVAVGVNTYSEDLTAKINDYLQEDEIGQLFTIGSLAICNKKDSLELFLENVTVDYEALIKQDALYDKMAETTSKKLGILEGAAKRFMQSGLTKNAASLAMTMAPDVIEKKGLELLSKEKSKQKMLALAQDAMNKKGIVVTLSEISLGQTEEDIVDAEIAGVETGLSEELEEFLLDAVAEYLKELGNRQGSSI